ncbi:hypothetical protein [Pandoraea sp. NPDC087047]|uniref:hypothetical protein n=1 Tax=Pandoraea sp. NPDC087047 TaxID=3364390 RepID=UPI00381AADB1
MTVKNQARRRDVPKTAKTSAPAELRSVPSVASATTSSEASPLAMRAATVDPTVVATIPDDFPNTPPYNYPLIRADRAGDDLNLLCDIALGLFVDDVYQYLLDGVAGPDLVELTNADLLAGKVTVPVDGADISESGVYRYQYQYRSAFEVDWSEPSDPTVFVIDVDPPGESFLGRLRIDRDVEDNGLTPDKLDALGGILPALVPSYSDRASGDVVIGYLTNATTGLSEETDPVQIAFGETGAALEVDFPEDAFKAVGDGVVELTYIVTDLAGNESEESDPVFVDVFISGVVDDFDPPIVPLFDDDGLINEEDARTPLTVEIPYHDKIAVGDTILVMWGDTPLLPPRVISGPIDPSEPVILEVDVPYSVVLSEWVAAGPNADGEASTDVTYIVMRASNEVGRPQTPATVLVNLNQAGGADPDPDTPENEALGIPVVHHSQWTTGGQENYIPDASIEEDHTFIVPWFERDDTGAITTKDAFIAGDVINARYDDQALTPYTVLPADVTAKADLELPLPWATVEGKGSGQFEIQYTVTRTPPVGGNISISPLAMVTAVDTGDLPGGGKPLPLAHFENNNVIWSRVGAAGFEPVIIPAYDVMKPHDIVRIHVTVDFWDRANDTLLGPVDEGEWGGDLDVNPHPVYEYQLSVLPTQVGSPLKFFWPSQNIWYVHPYGKARIQYYVTRDDGSDRVNSLPGVDQVVDTTNRPDTVPTPPPFAASANATATAQTRPKVSAKQSQRQAELNAFVNKHKTTYAERRARIARNKVREPVYVPYPVREGGPATLAEKLAQIARRPLPPEFQRKE